MTQGKQPEETELTFQDEEDILADVDIYLAYGMNDEAIAALERAIHDGRDRPEYRVRLVEAYAAAEDGKAVQDSARLARTHLDSSDHSLLGRIAAAEARFPGLEQAPEQTGGPFTTAPEGANGSSAPAGDPSHAATSDNEQIGALATGDPGAGHSEDREDISTALDPVAPDRDRDSRAIKPARWLHMPPWTAALFVASVIGLVFAVLSSPDTFDLARESESADSVVAEPRENQYPGGAEQRTGPPEATLPSSAGTPLIVAEVSFDANSTRLDAAFEPLLKEVEKTLADHPGTYAEVIGYAESTGTIEYSELLARQRAQAVTNRLIGLGAASNRIRVTVQGSGEPVEQVSRPEKAWVVEVLVRIPAGGQ